MLNINVKTTNTELTDALSSYVAEKVNNLERHFRVKPTNVDVELERNHTHQSGPVFRCEINVTIPGEQKILRAESTQTDMYAAIDTCLPKIKEQLDKEWGKRDALVKRGGRKLKELMRRLWD